MQHLHMYTKVHNKKNTKVQHHSQTRTCFKNDYNFN